MLRRSFLRLLGLTPVAALVPLTDLTAAAPQLPITKNPTMRYVQAASTLRQGQIVTWAGKSRVRPLDDPRLPIAGVACTPLHAGHYGFIRISGPVDVLFTVQ